MQHIHISGSPFSTISTFIIQITHTRLLCYTCLNCLFIDIWIDLWWAVRDCMTQQKSWTKVKCGDVRRKAGLSWLSISLVSFITCTGMCTVHGFAYSPEALWWISPVSIPESISFTLVLFFNIFSKESNIQIWNNFEN